MFIALLDEQGVPAEMDYYGSDMWDQPIAMATSAESLYLLGYTYGVVEGITPVGYADMVLLKLR